MLQRTQKPSREHFFSGGEARCTNEEGLHNQIIEHLRNKGWMYFHGPTMGGRRTQRTVGEPDFTILADNGRTLFIECKTATGKLSTEQQGMIAWAAKLGHTVHVVRSFEQFLEVVK